MRSVSQISIKCMSHSYLRLYNSDTRHNSCYIPPLEVKATHVLQSNIDIHSYNLQHQFYSILTHKYHRQRKAYKACQHINYSRPDPPYHMQLYMRLNLGIRANRTKHHRDHHQLNHLTCAFRRLQSSSWLRKLRRSILRLLNNDL